MTAPKSWRSIIPRAGEKGIPVIHGVPLVSRTPRYRAIATGPNPSDWELACVYPNWTNQRLVWLINLDNEQGFTWALRWLFRHEGGSLAWSKHATHVKQQSTVPWRYRHASTLAMWPDNVTDLDRIALAYALAEVVKSGIKELPASRISVNIMHSQMLEARP